LNPEFSTRQPTRLEPETAWTVMTEAPLKGLSLAREAGLIFAWDEADQLYLIDLQGEFQAVTRLSGKVNAGVISDDGSRIALVGEGARFWLLDADLGVVAERPGPPEPLGLAIDPHGRFALVSSRISLNQFYNRHGKPAGRFQTLQPLAFLAFVPDRPFLLAAAAYGMLLGFDLSDRGAGRLGAEPAWQDKQVSSVGRLTTTGDGGMVLASCFTHGVQRYDLQGQNEGSYHLGGTAVQAVPDFAGRTIAVATLEGELSVLNSAGNVRWKTGLPRPVTALEVDPLGRYLIYGHATGEVVRLDLYGSDRPKPAPRPATATGRGPGGSAVARASAGSSSVRRPDWAQPVVPTDDMAESAVLTVLDEPARVALIASNLRLNLFTTEGENLGYAPEISGVGRILRTSPGWVAAATDRQVVVYHATRNVAQRVDLSLVEVTHLAIRPDSFGLAVVQERDRVGRATIAGRWVWKQELKTALEDVAIGPDAHLAMTNDQGQLLVLDAAGITVGSYQSDPAEPLSLIEAVDGAPAGVVWMTLARRSQVLRGHGLGARVVWESPVAFEGWQFQRLGRAAVVSAADGRAQAFDGSGNLRGQGRASEGGAKDLFGANPRAEPRRVSRQGVNLICSDLEGRVRWRTVCDEPLGPVAVGESGVATMIGRSLAWFHGLD
jgi:hypothetical protein